MTKEDIKAQHDKALEEFLSYSHKLKGKTFGEMTPEERLELARLIHAENELDKLLHSIPW